MMHPFSTLLRSLALLLSLSLLLTACDSTDPGEEGAGEEEVISNVTITLENEADNSTITAEAVFDEAGVVQSTETLTLTAGATYAGTIALRDRFAGENITEEIDEERDEHQFFYVPQGDVSDAFTIAITDTDSNDNPVGLEFTVSVADDASGSGDLRVVLGHYDERPKAADETVDDTPETDIDFTYPVTIE
jgi:hypothetical protein